MNKILRLKTPCLLIVLSFLLFNNVNAQKKYLSLCLQGISSEKNGELETAAAQYTNAIALKPNLWKAYRFRSVIYFYQKNYNGAIDDVTRLIALKPDKTSYLYVRARAYYEKGEFEKAIADFNATIASDEIEKKIIVPVYNYRGLSYYKNGQYQEAINDFTQAINLSMRNQSESHNYNYSRAMAFFRMNKYSEAIADYQVYLAKYPSDYKSLLYQGVCYFKNQENDKAKENALKIFETDPSQKTHFYGQNLLEMFNIEKRRRTSVDLLKYSQELIADSKMIQSKTLINIKLNEAFSKLDSAWFLTPRIDKEDENTSDAIREGLFYVYSKLKVKPEISELARRFMIQAQTATENKKYVDAVHLWSSAIAIAPYYPIAYINRSLLWEILNSNDKAVSDLECYIKLAPEAEDARSVQDKIYEMEGKSKKSTTKTYINDPLMKNELKHDANIAKFVMRAGKSIPGFSNAASPKSALSDLKLSSAVDSISWKKDFFTKGNLGLQNGFSFEIGAEMIMGENLSRVQFYYNPILLSYSRNNLDWGDRYGIFTKNSVYTYSFRNFEIAQRYGISFAPIPLIRLAGYYRPSICIPSKMEVYTSKTTSDSTLFQVLAEPTLSALAFSNTFGLSINFSWFMIYYETASLRTKYDLEIEYNGTPTKYLIRTHGKIPFNSSRIGIAIRL
ncbi:MAG: tetratricopeptide repeat protein [Bacteroidota bacterium]